MKIIVCIKQVPGTTEVDIDPETGTLMREGIEAVVNPLDLGLSFPQRLGSLLSDLSSCTPRTRCPTHLLQRFASLDSLSLL